MRVYFNLYISILQSQAEIEDKYHKKIIEADCILYQAILCTTNQVSSQ